MKKLVRDRIPEIIRSKGEVAECYIADDGEYFRRLKDKLHEETLELAECDDAECVAEEMADVLEVLEAMREYYGISEELVMQVKAEKRQKRRGFSKKYILKLEENARNGDIQY